MKVEKQRILRESIRKSTNQSEGINSSSQASPRADKKLTTDVTSAEGSSQCKMVFNKGRNVASTSLNSFSETKKSFLANGMSSKSPENVKKPIRSSSSFFDKWVELHIFFLFSTACFFLAVILFGLYTTHGLFNLQK